MKEAIKIGMREVFRPRFKIALSILLCSSFIFSFAGSSSSSGCSSSAPPSVQITILHTNDIHTHIWPEPGWETNPYSLGGLSRIKTMVSQIRAQKTALLLDAGDWSEGVLPFYVDGGSSMLRMMDAIGYSAAVVGNHDFLNGPSEMANVVEAAKPSFSVLGANMNLSAPAISSDAARIQQYVQPYVILDGGNGIRVAVVGLLCYDLFYYSYFSPGVLVDPVVQATQITNMIHNNNLADVIVLLSHNSFSYNEQIAVQVPWVNVVISGHSHVKTPTAVQLSNAGNPVYIAETGQWGQFLGEMVLNVNTTLKQVTLSSYTLHPVTSSTAEDPTVAALMNDQQTAINTRFGKDIFNDNVATAEDTMPQNDNKEIVVGNLAADAYRDAAGAQLGLETSSLLSVGFSPGPLRTADLVILQDHIFQPLPGEASNFPTTGHSWTIKNLKIYGGSIRLLLGFILKYGSVVGVGPLEVSGLQVTYSATTSAIQPIQTLNYLDKSTGLYLPVNDSTLYTVGLHDGMITAIETLKTLPAQFGIPIDLTGIDLTQLTDTETPTWQAILNKVQAIGGVIRASDFAPGVRVRTIESDLSVFDHGVLQTTVPGTNSPAFNITIQNTGLTDYPGGMTLSVMRSAANDVVDDSRNQSPSDETFAVTPAIAISAIAAGGSTVIQVPWPSGLASGVYSITFQLLGNSTGLTGQQADQTNTFVRKHVQF